MISKQKRLERGQEPGQCLAQGVEHYFALDTNVLLNELRQIKKLDRYLKNGKWSGKIVIPYADMQELRGMYNGLRQKKVLQKDEKKRLRRAGKALSLIEKHENDSIWSFDRTKGTGIVKELLADERLFMDPNRKRRPSTNDLRILAVAIHLAEESQRNGKNRRIHIVTRDEGLKNAARISRRDYRVRIGIIGTLKWLWKFDWKMYMFEKKIKETFSRNGHNGKN